MVTKNEIKFIKSLRDKSFRNKFNLFVVEGEKSINEFLNSNYKVYKIYSTHPANISYNDVIQISEKQLIQISSLKTPNKHIAIFNKTKFPVKNQKNYFVLDSVNDPGNLGTMIRTLDWFGYDQLICSKNSVDCYNTKVVQSTMGSLSRVNVHYIDLYDFISSSNLPVYGASISGKSIIEFSEKKDSGIWIFGSESNGISDDLSKLINQYYCIPKGNNRVKTESLNLSTSFSIILSFLNLD